MSVTLEGVYRLIDRASPTLRSIERRASAADRAIDKLGRSMDKLAAKNAISNIDKLGGSMSKLEQNTGRVERVMDKTGATSKSLDRDMTKNSSSTNKLSSDMGKLETAMRKVLVIGGGLGKVLSVGKFALIAVAIKPLIGALSALGAGAVALVQQVGSATGAVVPLIARMGDLAGVGAAAATALISVKAAALVTKFAMTGVQQAIQGNVQAFKKLTPQAKEFVKEMRKLQPVVNTIRQSAQKGLFSGITGSIKTARSNGAFQVANTAAGGIGSAVGGVASRAVSQLTNPAVLNQLASLSGTVDLVITKLGASAINLAQAFITVLAAAQPLTRWIVSTVEQWSKYLLQQVQIAQETGRLSAYFQRTRTDLTALGHAARDFGIGFLNIMRVASGQAGSFGSGIDKIAKTFRDWTANFDNQARMALWFQRAQDSARRLGGILVDTLKIFQGLGKASNALGTSMTGGINKAMDHWATWINSFEGQNVLSSWFGGMETTLKAIWNLISDIGGAFVRLGAGGGGATGFINSIDRLIPDLEKVLNSFATNLGPGLVGTVTQLLHLLSTIASGSGSPLGLLLNLTNNILTAVNSVVDRFSAVRSAVVLAFTVISGALLLRKLAGIASGVRNIANEWRGVTVATQGATIAAAENAGVVAGESALPMGAGRFGGSMTGGFGRTASKAAGEVGTAEEIAVAGGAAGAAGKLGKLGSLAKFGRIGGGLATIAAPIAVGMGTSYLQGRGVLGGRTASNINNVVQMGATGALVGSFIPGLGTIAGGAIGAGLGLGMNALSGSGSGKTAEQKYMASLGTTAAAHGFDLSQPQGGAQSLAQANAYQHLLDQSRTRLLAQRTGLASFGALPVSKAASLSKAGFSGGSLGQVETLDKQIALNRTLRGESIARLATERAIAKAQEKQADALRAQARARSSQNVAAGLLTSYGNAYNVYRKGGMTTDQATAKTIANMESRAKTLNPAGAQVLFAGGSSWLNAMKKQHPELSKEYDAWDAEMKKTLKKMGVTMSTEGGNVQKATSASWKKIASAMQDPTEKAKEFVNTQFTDIQRQGVAMLEALGATSAQATAIITAMEKGKPGPTPGQLAALGQKAVTAVRGAVGGAHGIRRATGGRIPGMGLGDTVPINGLAAPGELIVNRHTEAKVNARLGGKGTLGGMVAGERKKHSDILPGYATGGRVSAAVTEANRIAAMRSTYVFGGGHSTPAPAVPPWDCSSATSRVLQAAGYDIPTMTAAQFMNWGEAGPGPIGVEASPGHVYMMLNGKPWGTSYSNYKGGAGWIQNGTGYRPGFVQRHAPNPGAGGTTAAGMKLTAKKRPTGAAAVALAFQGRLGAATSSTSAAAAMLNPGGGGGGGGGNSSQNQTLARAMMLQAGQGAAQWPFLQKLWTRESGFSTTAKNPSSGAYGIPQSLPASKMASSGSDYLTNPRTQINWGLGYISGRYGTPSAAWAHETSNNWYAHGGRVPEWGGWHAGGLDRTFDRPTMIGVGEGGAERVTVTPSRSGGAGGRGNVTVGDVHVHIHGGTNASAADIRRELDHWAEDFARLLERQSTEDGE